MTTLRTLPGHRASRSDNSMDWSPEELLRELLEQIEAGDFKPTNMIVLWNKENEKGEYEDHGWWASRVGVKLFLWMLETTKLERLLTKD